MMHPTLIG